jgi:dolichyl-diphosphooligosaccharide--protein glycosyltransferase
MSRQPSTNAHIEEPPPKRWRADVGWLVLIIAVALIIRIYLPWPLVYTGTHVNLFETDAWYHLRVIENLVAQFPHKLFADPYTLGGQAIKLPPLLDYLVAGTAWLVGLGRPSATTVTTVAVFTPPVLAGLTIVVVYATAKRLGGRLAALMAAALAAILPGHFLDRTLLGYLDHHALEALVSTTLLYLIARSLSQERPVLRSAAGLGLALLAMRLSWTSAAMIFAIVGVWLAAHLALQSWRRTGSGTVHRTVGLAGLVALALTLAFPGMEPFGVYLGSIALGLVAGLALIAEAARLGLARHWWSPRDLVTASVIVSIGAAITLPWLFPGPVGEVRVELSRFALTNALTSVSEARPLFMYEGTWSLRPAWEFFRTGFLLGLLAVVWLARRWWTEGRAIDLLIVAWTMAMYAATVGVNRFGYYLVPAIAIAGGALCSAVIDAGRRRGGWRQQVAVILVAGGAIGVNLGPTLATTIRPASIPGSWLPALDWLRQHAEQPFGDADYYYARYDDTSLPTPRSTVMAWWDYGYAVMAVGRRVPIGNPTGSGAQVAARFFTEVDQAAALAQLDEHAARYVLMDEQLPLSVRTNGSLFGKFQAVAETAGIVPSRFFDVYFLREGGQSRPIFLFHEDYYRTMAFRLGVLGGQGYGKQSTSVVSWRVDLVPGFGSAKVVTALDTFDAYDDAVAHRDQLGAGNHAIVGLQPDVSAVPIVAVDGLQRVFTTRTPGAFAQGAAQVFERRRP